MKNAWSKLVTRSYINANGKKVCGAANATHNMKNAKAILSNPVGLIFTSLATAGIGAVAMYAHCSKKSKDKS